MTDELVPLTSTATPVHAHAVRIQYARGERGFDVGPVFEITATLFEPPHGLLLEVSHPSRSVDGGLLLAPADAQQLVAMLSRMLEDAGLPCSPDAVLVKD